MLGSHGLGGVQSGSIERYLLDLGNVTRNVSLPQSFCLVLVPPVLEELLKQRCLTALREDLDLKQMSQPIRSSLASRPTQLQLWLLLASREPWFQTDRGLPGTILLRLQQLNAWCQDAVLRAMSGLTDAIIRDTAINITSSHYHTGQIFFKRKDI